MKKSVFLFAALCLLYVGCQDKDVADAEGKILMDSPIISISTTLVCGWFPNYDSIHLTASGGNHLNYCMKDRQSKEFTFTPDEWQALLTTIDLEKFNNFESNSCALCADGCDMSIGITTTSGYHRVKFAANDENLPAEVNNLALRLVEIRKSQQQQHCNN